MPELPEVEASRRYLERHCLEVFCGHSIEEVKRAFEGRRLLSAARHGKYFWTNMDGNGAQVLFHFGMTGHLIVRNHGHPYTDMKDKETWPPRFMKLELIMDDGTQIAFTDARRFAKIRLLADPPSQEPVKSLGPDAYTNIPAVQDFNLSLRASRRPVKALLIDQSFLAGIGNWVADEILYQASIFPETKANSMTETQAEMIHIAICDVLKTAVDAGAQSQKFPSSWLFHHRWTGKVATTTANGQAVQFLTVGGRTTAYVPAVQSKHRNTFTTTTTDVDNTTNTALDPSPDGTGGASKKRSRPRQSQDATPTQDAKMGLELRKGESKATHAGHACKSGRPVRTCRAARDKA